MEESHSLGSWLGAITSGTSWFGEGAPVIHRQASSAYPPTSILPQAGPQLPFVWFAHSEQLLQSVRIFLNLFGGGEGGEP